MDTRPLHDRLIVRRLEEGEQNIGGIIIPDTAKEKPQQGTVLAVGNGKVNDEGKRIPLDVNAQTETYENLVQAGVIDPTKVVRSALQNAASIASLLLTTEAIITQMPEKNTDAAMPGGGMGAGMY